MLSAASQEEDVSLGRQRVEPSRATLPLLRGEANVKILKAFHTEGAGRSSESAWRDLHPRYQQEEEEPPGAGPPSGRRSKMTWLSKRRDRCKPVNSGPPAGVASSYCFPIGYTLSVCSALYKKLYREEHASISGTRPGGLVRCILHPDDNGRGSDQSTLRLSLSAKNAMRLCGGKPDQPKQTGKCSFLQSRGGRLMQGIHPSTD